MLLLLAFLLPQDTVGSCGCQAFASGLKKDGVLHLGWIPQQPFSFWSPNMSCDEPVGTIVTLTRTMVQLYNDYCVDNKISLEWDCVTQQNGTFGNAVAVLRDKSGTDVKRFRLVVSY